MKFCTVALCSLGSAIDSLMNGKAGPSATVTLVTEVVTIVASGCLSTGRLCSDANNLWLFIVK